MMYSTNILLNLISTIFKTSNSSVDDTRKTLALFNKDWNTYKTNWQQGFASNGFAGGVKSIFQSTKSVVSPKQIQMLRTWNNAVKHGCTNQETFNKIIANADHNTKMYFAGLNKGKGTLDGLKNAQNATKASTIGLTIAQTALNMAISMGLMAAISLAIKGFDKMINHAKRASEAADEAFEETSSKVQEQQEELKTLDELISKYKELKKDGTLDIEGRKEVKELQNDIADLVGTQARNLDLVNGKLDDEIKKLDEISAKEAKNAYETATANYNNSQRANQNATGDDSFLFVDGYAYTGKREKDAEKILKEYGFGNNVQSGGFFGNTLFVMDTFDNDMNMLEGAQEKADYLQSMIDVLEQNGQRATELYSGLISQRDKYLNYIDNQQGAANTLVSSWITYSQYSNEELSKITVDSVESFEAYRQKMIEAAKNDESVGKLLSDGTLSEKDLEVAVNDFMATSIKFSDWYKQWIGDVQSSTSLDKMNTSIEATTKTLSTLQDKYNELKSAQDEYNSTGAISADTMQNLIDNGLLQYLDYSSGSLRINTEALLAEGEAAKVAAIQSLQKAMAEDLAAVAAGRDAEASTLAQTAIAGLGNNAETAGNQAQTAAGQLAGFAVAAQAAKEGAEGNLAEGVSVDEYRAKADAIIATYTNAANAIGNISIASPSSGGSKGSSSGSKKDPAKEAEEQAKKELEALKASLDTRKEILDRYKDAVDLTDYGLDLAEENDFALRADLLNNKMSQLTSYGEAMRKEFDRVASIIPETGEQAEALGSTLETLGANMRDNITAIRETQVAMQQLKIDSIASIGDYYLKDLESSLDDIEKRMELLNKDNKEDYKYTNEILSMKTFLPTRSSFGDLARERSGADRDIINAEQATQDTLNDILETQIEKNDKLREDERQALLADMETMRQDVAIKLESTNADYSTAWQTAQATTNTGINNIENALNNMNMKIPAPDISEVVKACELVKDMLNNMGNDDYTPPKMPISDGVHGGDANSIIKGNKANVVTNIAKNQLGVDYVWGGIAPYRGLDCSGLTQYAYGVAGVSLPRRSQEQWTSSLGTIVDMDNLKKGDQLFFGSNGEATHTGIYVGNGQMIHAPGTGKKITYQTIDDEYYQSNFLGAKRYATGTPKGNAQAGKLGIAGENFKPEILIDKATGERTYIDKPTVIDTSKVDVVGEKATANLPKFATGTVSTNDIANYIKENYPEITNAGIAALLANIEQESSFNPKAKTIEAYGSGNSKQVARWGLFQLDDTRISNWSDIVNNGTWQQQIDAALAEGRYSNSGMGSLSKYNVWDNVLTNASLSASEAAKKFDELYERSDGKSRDKRAQNAEKYFSQLEDNTLALDANTSALETDPIQEEINRIQAIPDEYVDQIGVATLSGKVQAQAIYNDDSLTDADKNAKLYEVYKPMAKEAASIGRDMYTKAMENYLAWQKEIEADPSKYSQEIEDAYSQLFEDIEEYTYSYEDRLVELRETVINNIVEPYDRTIALLENRSRQLDSQMQLAETRGLMTSTRYYEKMRDVESKKLQQLTSQRDGLVKLLNDGVASGDIEVGSYAWHNLQNQIDDITESISEATIAVADFDVQMRQILWDRFDYLAESFSNLTSEADFLINLLGEDLHKDNGKFNDEGIAVAGLHGTNYNVYMEKALSYARELAKIEKEIGNNPNDINLISRKQELLELQQESILAAESEKQAIVDLVEEGINLELESLQELINSYAESLDSAKSLYEYQQKIEEQAKNIATIEKQLAAYENDTSEETKARVQQLKVDLEEAQQNLKDTEYDKYISDQKDLLDDLYSQFEDTLNHRLDNVDGLIEDMIDTINDNASSIADTLKTETAKVGTELSDNMMNVWESEENALKSYLDDDGSLLGGFKLATDGYFDQILNDETGLTSVLGNIASDINEIMKYASDTAKTEEESDFTKNQMIQNSKDWWSSDEDTRQQLEKENEIYGSSLGYTKGEDGNWYDNDGDKAYEVSVDDKVKSIVDKMEQNSKDWHVSDVNGQRELEEKNTKHATDIANLTGKKVCQDGDGVWWIGNKQLYKAYKTGGLVDYTGLAQVDGSPSKPEMVLSPKDTDNFMLLKDYLALAAEKGLFNMSDFTIPEFSAPLVQFPEIKRSAKDVNVTNQFNIAIDHVEDYNDFVSQMQKDKQFEKMIQSMSVDLLAGKSSLAKNKYRW